jgi:hypothetical protein
MANTYTLIASSTVGSGGATDITFSSIASTYTDLVLKASIRSTFTGNYGNFIVIVNGVTTTASMRQLLGDGSAATSQNDTPIYSSSLTQASATANTFSNIEIYIPNYASSSTYKSMSIDGVSENNATQAGAALTAGLYSANTAITSIGIKPNGSPTYLFPQYSTAYLYGVKSS